MLKHLDSIDAIPVAQLTRFHVRRIVHPVATLPWAPSNVVRPVPSPSHALSKVPPSFLSLITDEGSLLEDLCIDWWELEQSDLEAILTNCPRLRSLQVAVSTSILDIVGMTTAFGSVPNLQELSVTSDPIHANTAPKAKPARIKKDAASDLPPILAQQLAETDPAVVEIRELRRFVRRLPHFRMLRWVGRKGKGEWRFSSAKRTTLTPIEFVHSVYLSRQIWEDCQRATLPVYTFEDDDDMSSSVLSLELPASPARSASDLPPLSRTTTGSSCSLPSMTPPSSVRRGSVQGDMMNGSVLGLDWEPLSRSAKQPPPPPLPSPTGTTWSQSQSPSSGKSSRSAEAKTSSRRRRDSGKPSSPSKVVPSAKSTGSKSIPGSRSGSPVKAPPPGRGPTCSLPSSPIAMREPVQRHVPGSAPQVKRRPTVSEKKQAKATTAAAAAAAVVSALGMPERDTADGWTKVGDGRRKK